MLGKRVLVTGLTLVMLVGIAGADTYYPTGEDANGRYGTFDWFDTDTWYSVDLTTDPNVPFVFTWSGFWNDPATYVRLNSGYYNGGLTHTTLDSATATCPRVVLGYLGIGSWWWDHYGDLRVNDMNVQNGTNNDGGWNPIDCAREGFGWLTFTDSQYRGDAIEPGNKNIPPFQQDYDDPNNDPADWTTWTRPYPTWAYGTWNTGGIKVTGESRIEMDQENGFGGNHFFLRVGRGRWATGGDNEPNGGRNVYYTHEGSNITFVDAANTDPNDGGDSYLRVYGNGILGFGIDAGGVSPINAGDTEFRAAPNDASNRPDILMYFDGIAAPVATTTYTIVNTRTWNAASSLPVIHPASDNAGNWSLAIVGTQLQATYNLGAVVHDVKVFHNNSTFDGDAGASANDDNAIDTSKSALLPGGASAPANIVCNEDGINGIMVDIGGLAGTPTAADFTIERSGVSNGAALGDYGAAAGPTTVAVRAGAGALGSDRVTLIFPDSDADNSKWMRVTVKATAQTGLASDYVFYLGLAVGDTGDSAADYMVTANDRLGVRNNPHNFLDPAPVDDAYDFDRDTNVNAIDRLAVRNHQTNFLSDLQVIVAP